MMHLKIEWNIINCIVKYLKQYNSFLFDKTLKPKNLYQYEIT